MTTPPTPHTPLLDIILPVYNTERYLDQCIQSIVNQEFNDWHLIIIDDGSTDASPEICDSWAKSDKRITVIHKANSGQADSRNVGIDLCTAEYVGFVDSDDRIEPNMYSFLLQTIKENDADIAVCNHYSYTTMGSKCKHPNYNIEVLNHDQATELIIQNRLQSYIWQMVFKRSCLNYHMPEHICFEDHAVLPHWFEKARRVVIAMRPLYHYRMRRSSVFHSVNPQHEFAFLEAEKQRFKYYRNTKFKYLASIYITTRAIRVAKHIARMKTDRKVIAEYMERIKTVLGKHAPGYVDKLKFKDKLLYRLLMLNTSLFINYIKAEKLLKINKKAEDRNYFD